MGRICRLFFFLCLLLGLKREILAQDGCATDEVYQNLLRDNPPFKKITEAQGLKWRKYIKGKPMIAGRPGITENDFFEIPVAIHVIHAGQPVGSYNNPSDDDLIAMIAKLNAVFAGTYNDGNISTAGSANIPIRFKLAQRTPNCQSTNGINRVDGSILPGYSEYGVYYNGEKHGPYDSEVKALSRWPYESYMNIWIVTQIYGSVPGGGGVAGYATYPGVFSPETDGVVVINTGIDLLAHEVGHYLWLHHTFEGSGGTTCPPNNDCTIDGDQICDTEPHYSFGCNNGINPCTNQPWGSVVRNFMNYYSCQGIFTAGQRDRMLYALEELRPNLLTSLGGLPPEISPVVITSPIASCSPPGVIHPGYDMGPRSVRLADMHVVSRGNYGDNNQYYVDYTLPNCVQNQPVAHLNKGGTYTLTVIADFDLENVRGWIDFNNDGIFQASELVISSNGTVMRQAHIASFTVPSTEVVTCTSLRMRIMSDLAAESPPQPCSFLQYGQAEDFIVIIQDPASPTPSVTIAASTTNLICEGTSVTFTATSVNGGNNPAYQWKKNGINVGVNNWTYISNGLVNGDIISCIVTPTVICPAYPVVVSNQIVMSVSPSHPSVSISATPAGVVCEGAKIVFKANPTNGGSNPIYQWKKNGIAIGTDSDTFSIKTLVNGDVISCVMTIRETCPASQSATSNPIALTVSSPPSGTFITPPPVASCIPGQNRSSGYSVGPLNITVADLHFVSYNTEQNYIDHTFPAMPNCLPLVGHLKIDSNYIITIETGPFLENVKGWIDFDNDGIFQSSELIISSLGTTTNQTHISSFTVPSTGIATCTSLRMRIRSDKADAFLDPCSPLLYGQTVDFIAIIQEPAFTAPSISISGVNGVCEGTSVTFTATAVNAGNYPTYDWRVNGFSVGTNSNTFSSDTLKNGDVVSCLITSSGPGTCTQTAGSNSISMAFYAVTTPTVTIAPDITGPICAGTNVTFWASWTNAGLAGFNWKINGIGVSNRPYYYSTNALKNGDVVTCEIVSPDPCSNPRTATSPPIVIEVLPGPMPSVTVCANANGIFTATALNFSSNPNYQWKLNGTDVGTNNTIYTNNTLRDGDFISCFITGATACASLMTATSNIIRISSDTVVRPEIYVYPDKYNSICPGTSVTFTAAAVNGGANPKYQWKVGSTLVGTDSPTYTITNLTNGAVVTCTLTSNASCTNIRTVTSEGITVSVSAPPLATVAAAGPLSFCAGKNVLLKANTGTGYTYQWKKAGIDIENATLSNYTATTAGAYSVVITNATGCSASSALINVTANAVPLANVAAASALTFCEGKTVQLKAITGTGYTYQWKRGATDIAGATSSNYTASATGFYTVVVTNANGCSASSAALAVVVKPLPAATITAAGPTTFCSGKNVLLKANTGTNYNYQWIRGATPIPGGTQANYSATQPGLYTVVVTNVSGCSVTSAAIAVSVNPLPVANITSVGSLTFCAGQSVLLRANTGTNYTYQWKKAGINIPDATAVNYTAIASGIYSVVVTNAAGCPVTSATVAVTVNNAPLANVAAAGATTFCSGKSVLLKAITGTGYTYQWKKNNINIPNEITSSYTATATGNYSVVVTNPAGCSTTSTVISVAVTPAPLATVAIAGPTTFCVGSNVLLKAITGTGYSYQWKNNGINIPTQTQSSYTATATGVYTVAVTNTEGCSTLSTNINVTVTPAPVAIITSNGSLTFPQGGNVLLNASAAAGNTYQWQKDGVSITGATIESYSATVSGSYTVAITNAGGCQAVSQPTVVTVTQTRPITKGYLEEEEMIRVYPNPLYRNDYVNIDWNISDAGNGIFVTVYDITGRRINSQRLKPGDNTVKITGASGMYVVELKWGVDKRKTFRVIKID